MAIKSTNNFSFLTKIRSSKNTTAKRNKINKSIVGKSEIKYERNKKRKKQRDKIYIDN